MNTPTNPEEERPSLLWGWVHLLLSPGLLFNALIDVGLSALATRPWRRLLLFSPVLIMVAAAAGLIVYGRSLPREDLIVRYANWAQEEVARLQSQTVNQRDEAAEPLLAEEATSAYSDMLYRRLLQLNDSNARTRYAIAEQMARSQRLPQARRLMQEIAPLQSRGYPPAHAWLAVDLLSKSALDSESQQKILAHMSVAREWQGTSGKLLAVYAELLLRHGQPQQALDVLGQAAERDDSLRVAYAALARQLNMSKLADEASADARAELKVAIGRPDAQLQQFVQLATLELTEKNYKAAFETARSGLARFPKDNDRLRYLSSEALRLMYRESIRKTPVGLQLNLNLLDAAMKEFPSNPNLSAEIALLDEMGVMAPPEFKAKLEEQLASGQATALAHLILANQELKAGRLADAIPHLELTLKSAPNHPVALNNLALSLAKTDPSKIGRAEELIAQAIAVDGRNPELYDTQGQIRLLARRPLDAVESLEKAIGIDPNRPVTRQFMIEAYRAAGLEDMARTQERILEKITTAPRDEASPNSNASVSTPTGKPEPANAATPTRSGSIR